jgi:CheY-like chemotaxis protein
MTRRINRRTLILVCALSLCGLGSLLLAHCEAQGQSGADEAPVASPQSEQLPPKPIAWLTKPAQAPVEAPGAPRSAASKAGAALVLASLLGGAFAFGILAPRIAVFLNRLDPWVPEEADSVAPDLFVEEPALAEFFLALRASLNAPAAYAFAEAPGLPPGLQARAVKRGAGWRLDPFQEFIDSAPWHLASLRTLLSDVSRATDDAARQKVLGELFKTIGPVKDAARLPALLPVWQMAAALEGLLKQLTGKAATLTPSTLRTVASALDLLELLCVPGLKPDLATNPPVRLMAVDDDPISLRAISMALKKALTPPDLAASGKAALALATRRSYDVIFLDVEMPGMDGFQLCPKIHETTPNRTTPVVFVTSHNDFNSRAKSTLTGGEDLISKPFLSFELTLKTLTMALRARLANGCPEPAH